AAIERRPREARVRHEDRIRGAADHPAARSEEHAVATMDIADVLRDRSLRLAAALAVAVAIPVAVLFYFQFRSLNGLSRSSAVVLRQLSNETANGLTKAIEDELKAPHIEVLLRVTQGRTEPLDLPFIKDTVDRSFGKTPFLSRFYVWSTIGT